MRLHVLQAAAERREALMSKKIFMYINMMLIAFSLAGCSDLAADREIERQTNQPSGITASTSKDALKLSSVKMVTEDTGWASGNGSILRTIDGGSRWEDVTPPGKITDPRDTAWEFLDSNTAWMVTSTKKGLGVTVFHTNDGGRNWQSAPVPVESNGSELIIRSFDFVDSEHGWMMLQPEHGMNSSPGQLFSTADSGATWLKIADAYGYENPPPGTLPFGGTICFRDSANGWVVGSNASTTPQRLFITQDGGYTWKQQSLTLPSGLPKGKIDVAGPPVFFSSDSKEGAIMAIFIPDSYKTVEYATVFYITRDGGLTWQCRNPVDYGDTAVDFVNADEWWYWQLEPRDSRSTTPAKGKFCHTSDGGKTWSEISPDNTLKELLQQGQNIMEVDFFDSKTGWMLVASRNASSNTLLKTTDGGSSWTRVYPAGDAAVRNTDTDKRIDLYVTAMKAAFHEENGGNGFIAVKLDTLKDLKNQKEKEKVLEGLRELSPLIYDYEQVKADSTRFRLDERGLNKSTINGTVLWLNLKEYQGDTAVITAVSWFGSLGAVFPEYKAVYKDGKWHLTLVKMAVS